MVVSVYTYKGIPLKEYCKENGLNFYMIKSRIYTMQKDEKYRGYSIDEIIDLAFKKESGIKYMYKGVRLSAYCKENNLNTVTIRAKIHTLREDSNYSNLSDDEVIEEAIRQIKKGKYRYLYKGAPLLKYCTDNNISYRAVLFKLNELKNNEEYKDNTNDELVELALEDKKRKYYYGGKSLYIYCKENNLKYVTFLHRFLRARKKNENSDLTDEQLIESIMQEKEIVKYFYNGVSLLTYCENKGINYNTILNRIHRIREDETYRDTPIDEVVEMAINDKYAKKYKRINKKKSKYQYNGIDLKKYCDDNGLNLQTIRLRIYHLRHDEKFSGCSEDEVVKYAIESFKDKRVKFNYRGKSLFKYCKDNNLSYIAIRDLMYSISKDEKYKHFNEDEIIEKAISCYTVNEREKRLLLKLKQGELPYRVNYGNVEKLSKRISVSKAINIVRYFGDKEDELGNKVITSNKINELKKMIANLKNDFLECDLYDLIGLYKCKLYDTRECILKVQEKYINNYIFSLCDKYNIEINESDKEDFKSVLNLAYLESLDKIKTDDREEINYFVNGYVREKIENYMENYCSNLLVERANYEEISNEKIENNFKKNIKNCNLVSSLAGNDRKFIELLYFKNYNYAELAKIFGESEDKIMKKEKEILNKIKLNIEIKR